MIYIKLSHSMLFNAQADFGSNVKGSLPKSVAHHVLSSRVETSPTAAAGDPISIDHVGIVRVASFSIADRFKVNHNGFILGPRCIINGPGYAETFYDQARFTDLA